MPAVALPFVPPSFARAMDTTMRIAPCVVGQSLRSNSFAQLHGLPPNPDGRSLGHSNSADRADVDWQRVFRLASVAACATIVAQVVACPLDVAQRLAKRSHVSLPAAFAHVLKTGTLFNGLNLRLIKRAPTKCISVALLELATDKLHTSRARRKHFLAAATCSSLALLATYPLHAAYYAMRKGVGWNLLLSCVRHHYRNLYAGVVPALAAVAPVMLADQCLYKSLRGKFSQFHRVLFHKSSSPVLVVDSVQSAGLERSVRSCTENRRMAVDVVSLVLAAAVSASVAQVIGEPFKQVSRRVAVESVRSASNGVPSALGTAKTMWSRGPAEFWRGYRTRVTHYAISASITRLTVEKLRSLV